MTYPVSLEPRVHGSSIKAKGYRQKKEALNELYIKPIGLKNRTFKIQSGGFITKGTRAGANSVRLNLRKKDNASRSRVNNLRGNMAVAYAKAESIIFEKANKNNKDAITPVKRSSSSDIYFNKSLEAQNKVKEILEDALVIRENSRNNTPDPVGINAVDNLKAIEAISKDDVRIALREANFQVSERAAALLKRNVSLENIAQAAADNTGAAAAPNEGPINATPDDVPFNNVDIDIAKELSKKCLEDITRQAFNRYDAELILQQAILGEGIHEPLLRSVIEGTQGIIRNAEESLIENFKVSLKIHKS